MIVQGSLDRGRSQEQHVLKLWGEGAAEDLVPTTEDESLEEGVEHVGTIAHQLYILQ